MATIWRVRDRRLGMGSNRLIICVKDLRRLRRALLGASALTALGATVLLCKSGEGHRFFPCRMCHPKSFAEKREPKGARKRPQVVSDEVEKKCRTCHRNLPKPPKSHPAYVTPTSKTKIPRDMPLDRRRRVVCCTCHDPHPSVKTPFMVRRKDVTTLCKSCHHDIGL